MPDIFSAGNFSTVGIALYNSNNIIGTVTILNGVKNFTMPAKTRREYDSTHMASTNVEYSLGLPDYGTSELSDMLYAPNSPTDILLEAISDSAEPVQIQYTVPLYYGSANTKVSTFIAKVQDYKSNINMDGLKTATVTFRIIGKVAN